MSADDKVNMTLEEIIQMDKRSFKKGPGSVHSVGTVRSSFSINSQRSRWSQRSRTPYRNRSASRGWRSRSRTPARSEMTISRFPWQNHTNGSTISLPVTYQRKKMPYRNFYPSGVKYGIPSQFPKQPNSFQIRYSPYNRRSVLARLQYAKNRVRLAKQTLNRSQQIYIQQLKELQKQLIENSGNYNTSPQFGFRNSNRKETTIINQESSPAPKQSLTVCIKNELAMRNWSRAGGKLLPNRYSKKGYLITQPAGKIFQSPASLSTIVYKTGSSLNDRFSSK